MFKYACQRHAPYSFGQSLYCCSCVWYGRVLHHGKIRLLLLSAHRLSLARATPTRYDRILRYRQQQQRKQRNNPTSREGHNQLQAGGAAAVVAAAAVSKQRKQLKKYVQQAVAKQTRRKQAAQRSRAAERGRELYVLLQPAGTSELEVVWACVPSPVSINNSTTTHPQLGCNGSILPRRSHDSFDCCCCCMHFTTTTTTSPFQQRRQQKFSRSLKCVLVLNMAD